MSAEAGEGVGMFAYVCFLRVQKPVGLSVKVKQHFKENAGIRQVKSNFMVHSTPSSNLGAP